MKVVEILIPRETVVSGLSPHVQKQIDFLTNRIETYIDKIANPQTGKSAKEFLKKKIQSDYLKIKNLQENNTLSESVNAIPITDEDFSTLRKIFEKPVPAIVARIFINGLIDDDSLNQELDILENSDPGKDVRDLLSNWFRQVLPDQIPRLLEIDDKLSDGQKSIIQGKPGPSNNRAANLVVGNAYGRF